MEEVYVVGIDVLTHRSQRVHSNVDDFINSI